MGVFSKWAWRPNHNIRSTNAQRRPRSRHSVNPDTFKICRAHVLALRRVSQTVFTSRALYMDWKPQTPPRTAASTWVLAEYSSDVSGAFRLFIWPELVISLRSHSPFSSALSRWRRGAAAPLLVTTLGAGGSGRGAYRKPAEPPAQSDLQASTDTRPLSVCPIRSPWLRACEPATRTSIRPVGVLQRWSRRWTGSWGEWHDGGADLSHRWGGGGRCPQKARAPQWAARGAAVAVLPDFGFVFLQKYLRSPR